jgi:hypothetical protein
VVVAIYVENIDTTGNIGWEIQKQIADATYMDLESYGATINADLADELIQGRTLRTNSPIRLTAINSISEDKQVAYEIHYNEVEDSAEDEALS